MSAQLEKQVVGAVLADADTLHDLPAGFSAAVLRNQVFRQVFLSIQAMAARKALPSGPVDLDLLAVEARLDTANLVGKHLLRDMVTEASSGGRSTVEYAKALLKQYRRAELARVLQEAQELLKSAEPEEVSAKIQTELLKVDNPDRREWVSECEVTVELMAIVEATKKGKGVVLRTGFSDIDEKLWIRPGNLILLAARTGVGKTTLAVQLAGSVTGRGEHVAFHSLEMTRHEVQAVNLAREAKLDSRRFFDDREPFNEVEVARVVGAADRRVGPDLGFLHINDSYGDLGSILRISEKLHRKHRLALIVVDYLQLVTVQLGRNANRENQVAFVSRSLKELATRLGVPVLALAQINREGAKRGYSVGPPKCAKCNKAKAGHDKPNAKGERPDHRFEAPLAPAPKLTDLRDSGALEQDANAVVILHNPYEESEVEVQRTHGPFELIVAKQRMGPKGFVRLYADLERSAFRPSRDSAGAYAIPEDGNG